MYGDKSEKKERKASKEMAKRLAAAYQWPDEAANYTEGFGAGESAEEDALNEQFEDPAYAFAPARHACRTDLLQVLERGDGEGGYEFRGEFHPAYEGAEKEAGSRRLALLGLARRLLEAPPSPGPYDPFHPKRDGELGSVRAVAEVFGAMRQFVDIVLADSPKEKVIAFAKLDEAVMWTTRGITHGE